MTDIHTWHDKYSLFGSGTHPSERIQVQTERSGKEDRVLRNDCELLPKIMKTHVGYVKTVDEDLALRRFNQSEQSQSQGGLSCSGTTDDSDFFSRLHGSGDVFDDKIEPVAISSSIVVEENLTVWRPIIWRPLALDTPLSL